MPAVKIALTAMPASTRRATPPPPRPAQATEKTSAAAIRPKTSALIGTHVTESGTASSSSIAPKPAPAVTPMMSGDASGLASAPWSSDPATASAAPTTTAVAARGIRSSLTIW